MHTCTDKNCQSWEIVNFDKYAFHCLNVLSAGIIYSVTTNDTLYSAEIKLEKHMAPSNYGSFTLGQRNNRQARDFKPTISWTCIKCCGYRGWGSWCGGPFGCCRGLPRRSCKGILGAVFKTEEIKGIKREEKYSKRTKLNCKVGSLIQHELLKTHFHGPCTVGGHKTTLCAPSG